MEIGKELSKEAGFNVELTAEGLSISVKYDGKLADAELSINVSVIELLRELAKKTDNKIDDMLVEMVAKAL